MKQLRTLALIANLMAFACVHPAHAFEFHWVATSHGGGAVMTSAIDSDALGRVLDSGSGPGEIIHNPGGSSWVTDWPGYARVLGADRQFQWRAAVQSVTSTLAIFDSSGGVVLAGAPRFQSSSFSVYGYVGNSLAEVWGARGPFLWKLDAAGNSIWVRVLPVSSSGSAFIQAMGAGPDGSIVVAGRFSGQLNLDPGTGTYNLVSRGGNDGFAAAYSSQGELLWGLQFGGAGNDEFRGLSVTSQSIHLVGGFSDSVSVTIRGQNTTLVSAGETDGVVLRLDLDGQVNWAGTVGGPQSDYLTAVKSTPKQLLLAGFFRGTARIEPTGQVVATSAGGTDILLASLDHEGALRWARRIGGSNDDYAFALASGSMHDYVGGSFARTVDFGGGAGHVLGAVGADDAFLLKLDSDGTTVDALRLGGGSLVTGQDRITALTVDQDGAVLSAGVFQGDVDFDPAPSSQYIVSNSTNWSDGFAWKLRDDGALQATLAGQSTPVSVGDTFPITLSLDNQLNGIDLHNLGAELNLPSGLRLLPGSGDASCAGLVEISPEGDRLTLSGATLPSAQRCDVTMALMAMEAGPRSVSLTPAQVTNAQGARILREVEYRFAVSRSAAELQSPGEQPTISRPGQSVAFPVSLSTPPYAAPPTGPIDVVSDGASCQFRIEETDRCDLVFSGAGDVTVQISYAGDANYLPASISLIHSVRHHADLSVSAHGPSGRLPAFQPIDIDVVVKNLGPDPAEAAHITSHASHLDEASWSCLSGCKESGAGAIDLVVPLEPGDAMTLRVSGIVMPEETDGIELVVDADPGTAIDTDPDNNSARYRADVGLFANGFELDL